MNKWILIGLMTAIVSQGEVAEAQSPNWLTILSGEQGIAHGDMEAATDAAEELMAWTGGIPESMRDRA